MSKSQEWRAYVYNQFQTTMHKLWVAWYIIKFCGKLLWRATVHDLSKYSGIEAHEFAKVCDQLKRVEYGSPEYKELLKQLEPCLKHHYSKNSHHPEHYEQGFAQMSGLDRIEMVADWCAATRRMKNGNVKRSISLNQSRFSYSDADRQWLELVAAAMQPRLFADAPAPVPPQA